MDTLSCKKEVITMSRAVEKSLKRFGLTVSKPVLAVLCIIFGIIVIVVPELITWAVGLLFVIEGILLFTDYLELRR